jgi:Flp pilus assembly protein TadB
LLRPLALWLASLKPDLGALPSRLGLRTRSPGVGHSADAFDLERVQHDISRPRSARDQLASGRNEGIRVRAPELEVLMLWTVVVVLLILWLLGFSLHIGGALIHLLLVVGLVVLVVNLLSGRSG